MNLHAHEAGMANWRGSDDLSHFQLTQWQNLHFPYTWWRLPLGANYDESKAVQAKWEWGFPYAKGLMKLELSSSSRSSRSIWQWFMFWEPAKVPALLDAVVKFGGENGKERPWLGDRVAALHFLQAMKTEKIEWAVLKIKEAWLCSHLNVTEQLLKLIESRWGLISTEKPWINRTSLGFSLHPVVFRRKERNVLFYSGHTFIFISNFQVCSQLINFFSSRSSK